MSEENLKNSVKEPVKRLTAELVSGIVFRVTKAGTKRTVNDLKRELNKAAADKLQKRLETISDRKIENLVNENTESTTSKITQEGVPKEQIIRDIEEGLRKRLKDRLTRIGKSPVSKGLAISAVLVIAIGTIVAAATLLSEPDDTIPPELELYISAEAPQPGERVTFTVEAYDDSEIGWIELVVNGELVEEGDLSPMVFTGGPYEEGAIVMYSASAYDVTGNMAWSGERTFQVAVSRKAPDLVILEVSHEWLDIKAGLCLIRYVIQNRGDNEAGRSLTVLRYNGEIIGEDIVPVMKPGEIVERVFSPVELSPAGFTVDLCSDFEDIIEETDENNNCFSYVT
ncbi:MAG: CARDB domain-containing protein [Dehalococcoidales bacterium]|nr:CARDB domain-containing protein [Dehalococcoidales bacterium]